MTPTRYSLVAAIICLSGCQGWHQVARPEPGGSLEGSPALVRVTRTVGCGATPTRECVASRGTVNLYNPRIQGDSLIGYYDSNQGERVAMHVRDVVKVESQQISKTRTAGAAIGSGVILGALVAVGIAFLILTSLGSN